MSQSSQRPVTNSSKPPAPTIQTAKLHWQLDDNGVTVPRSSEFGDVYFSKTDGLAESRHVFIDGNELTTRLANLRNFERFVIGEIGFGTGLNILAIWQLWQQIRPDNHSHLHIITTEKFPLSKTDLAQALSVWTELVGLSQQLIANYPPPLAGCHRLNWFDERLTIDLWLGDATSSLSQVTGQGKVDAWLLDGFAPSCNQELWSESLLAQIARLSKPHTTLATFSVASAVKQGLKHHGFTLAKRKGFGKKREMLTASFQPKSTSASFCEVYFRYNKKIKPFFVTLPFTDTFESRRRQRRKANKAKGFELPNFSAITKPLSVAVIGAGVAGLSSAYALAARGHKVTIFDKAQPLAGASGNIRGFLAPKLTSLKRLETNLHAIGYLASCRFYPYLTAQTGIKILQTTGCVDLLSHNRLQLDEVQDFPPQFARLLTAEQAKAKVGYEVGQAIFLPNAGLITTANFANAVLCHPNISFQTEELAYFQQAYFQQDCDQVLLTFTERQQFFDHVILCMALDTCNFLPTIKRFNHSRGQVTWFAVDEHDKAQLPKLPLKYGSYYASFNENSQCHVMLGASFVRDTLDTTPAIADHKMNVADLADAVPDLVNNTDIFTVEKNIPHWQGRASIRSQTVDYLPLVGQVWQAGYESNSRVWSFSALGSKGYAYAPICSELLVGLLCGEILPLANKMVNSLSPNRKVIRR
ncbi:FAD-dependent 5-carboxymethylaminomethyl-2-thiouridine(34) oxidoreductase MnmC [Moraxella osloensis]|nr:FAD-dependent 5-carboxymethylaminomethyl-2-thiouridine(34) oxidoreductase MnmC [Moraxella osloensis]MBW4019114.1 FAD-dependent 5-carboxymethylaminomethyl-2-thiouridine(34) oxidoreductase MnmC [Moraxella osloensis]